MAVLRIRSAVARLVIVAVLAIALLVESLAVGPSSRASAEPNYTCSQALAMARLYFNVSTVFSANGNVAMSYYYFGKGRCSSTFATNRPCPGHDVFGGRSRRRIAW
jgi:hypothetical protein